MFLSRFVQIAMFAVALTLLAGCTSPKDVQQPSGQPDRPIARTPAVDNTPSTQSKAVKSNRRSDIAKATGRPAISKRPRHDGSTSAKAIVWAKDWASARKMAGASNKLIMVDFYTDWCGWCKRLDRDTYSNKNVIRYANQFVSLKLNAEKEGRSLARKHRVRGYPTILFFDAKGKVVNRIGGYLPPGRFLQRLKTIHKSHSKT